MPHTWKLSYGFRGPIEYASGPLVYPKLGITFVVEDSKIVRVERELVRDDALSGGDVLDLPAPELDLLWEILTYRRGSRVQPVSASAEQIA